jgi:hypothetical protein
MGFQVGAYYSIAYKYRHIYENNGDIFLSKLVQLLAIFSFIKWKRTLIKAVSAQPVVFLFIKIYKNDALILA